MKLQLILEDRQDVVGILDAEPAGLVAVEVKGVDDGRRAPGALEDAVTRRGDHLGFSQAFAETNVQRFPSTV
jgi:hypothetical protein